MGSNHQNGRGGGRTFCDEIELNLDNFLENTIPEKAKVATKLWGFFIKALSIIRSRFLCMSVDSGCNHAPCS